MTEDAPDEEFEAWLVGVVANRYDANNAEPTRALTMNQVIAALRERRERQAQHPLQPA